MSVVSGLVMVPLTAMVVSFFVALAMCAFFYIPEVIRTDTDRECAKSMLEIFFHTFVYCFALCCVLLFVGVLSGFAG